MTSHRHQDLRQELPFGATKASQRSNTSIQMIHSRPQSNALFAVGVFLLLLLAAGCWLLVELIEDPSSYFLPKLILIPTLLVIGIVVVSKSYYSAVTITLGNDRLTYRYPLGSKKKHKISDISTWQEKVIKRKSSTYRRLSIQLVTGKKLLLSNHENGDYENVVKYLRKKVRTKGQ